MENMNNNGGQQYRQNNNNQPMKAENNNSTSTCNNKNVCMKSAAIGFGSGVAGTLLFFGIRNWSMKRKMKKLAAKAEKESAPAPEKEAK